MFSKLESLEQKYVDLEKSLSDPNVFNDQEKYRKLAKAHSDLSHIVELFRKYKSLEQDLADTKLMEYDSDPEIKSMVAEEIKKLETTLQQVEYELKIELLPTDPLDEKNILLEIRAGTGGEEASLFAGDLLRMYCRYAERMNWKVEIMSQSPSDSGGYKEVIVMISGDKVYSRLKFESGTHRVQRVPTTESQGRIHTSAATVAIIPEAEEVDIDIKPEDLRFDVYRSSGPGGQSVNTTDSAVRVTHIPTGLVVCCQDEKSQHKSTQISNTAQNAAQADQRRAQVGSGDRSERIRTYNFPQGRCTDHRINLTLYSLPRIMDGELQEIIDALATSAQAKLLASSVEDK